MRFKTLLLTSVFLICLAAKGQKAQDSCEIYSWLKTVAETVSLVEQRSFRMVDFTNFFKTALKSAISTIDTHSAFITNFEEMSDSISGNFSGIGITVVAKATEDDSLVVMDVVEDGPAFKVGMQAGDKIITVND